MPEISIFSGLEDKLVQGIFTLSLLTVPWTTVRGKPNESIADDLRTKFSNDTSPEKTDNFNCSVFMFSIQLPRTLFITLDTAPFIIFSNLNKRIYFPEY